MIIGRATARRGEDLFRRFRDRPGSGFIASGFALGHIEHAVASRRPRTILEVGAGIGTISAAIIEAGGGGSAHGERATHVAVEDVPFCLEQLEENIGDGLDQMLVVARAADVPAEVGPFDLVIIDGGASTDLEPAARHTWTIEDERAEIRAWIGRLAPGALVVVENDRASQRRCIEAEATRPYVHEHVRPFDASPGLHYFWFDPSPVRRISVAVCQRLRALWFPRGIRLVRFAYYRASGRVMPGRDTVATGDGVPT